jgi:light-regulated signal transduction histidine kinase (bacteriophytochrome)
MSQSEVSPTQITNLIEHEPIELSISIQPHGVLLALNPQLVILQVSNNTEDLLGKKPEDLLGQPLSNLLDSEQVKAIEQCCNNKEVVSIPLNCLSRLQKVSNTLTV